MGQSFWLLLFFHAYITPCPSRACSSRSSIPDQIQDIKLPPEIPPAVAAQLRNFEDNYNNVRNFDEYGSKRNGNGTTTKVINATRNVAHGDFPYQVSLQRTDKQNKHFCSAIIIRPNVLLSAAHCFDGEYQVPHIRAVAGEHYLNTSDGSREQIRQVIYVAKHESYSAQTWDNDIALLVLDAPLNYYNKYVQPAILWDAHWPLPRFANVSGWEIEGSSSGSETEGLMAAEIKIRDHWDCASKFKTKNFIVTSNRICAGGFRDTCRGDSGGPLSCLRSLTNGQKQNYLCGVASWDVSCVQGANSNYPGVYTDITKYREWMERSRRKISVGNCWATINFVLIHIYFHFMKIMSDD